MAVAHPTHWRFKDLTGQRFGRLVAVEYSGQNAQRNGLWLCRCDCGTSRQYPSTSLTNGHTRSCGCMAHEETSARFRVHGKAKTPTWQCWSNMRRRCTDATQPMYHLYGGRGISVCLRWSKFQNFLADMGVRPPGTSIDRLDNNGNYEPSNCRWATAVQQANNKRNNRLVTVNGRTQTIAQWSSEIGIGASTLCARLDCGWSPEKTMTSPKCHS